MIATDNKDSLPLSPESGHWRHDSACPYRLVIAAFSVLLLCRWFIPVGTNFEIPHYLFIHTGLEIAAVSFAVLVFSLGWNSWPYLPSNTIIWLSCCFMGVAWLDFSHLMSFAGMPEFITPADPEKAINFWLMARTLAVTGLLGMALIQNGDQPLSRYGILAGVACSVAAIHFLVLMRPQWLPATFHTETGLTSFKVIFEYSLMLLYLGAAVLFWKENSQSHYFSSCGLAAVALLMAISEYCFTLYSSVADFYNLLGHLYKILAYLVLYYSLFVTGITRPYQDQQDARLRLKATISALPDWFFELDTRGRIIKVHAAPHDEIYPADQLAGASIDQLMSPEAAATVYKAMQEALITGISRGARINLGSSGNPHIFELSISSHAIHNHQGLRYLVLARNETANELQKQALASAARLNENLLNLLKAPHSETEPEFARDCAKRIGYLTNSPCAWIYLRTEERSIAYYPAAENEICDVFSLSDDSLQRLMTEPEARFFNHSDAFPLQDSDVLQRLLCIPVSENGEVQMLACAANREGAYQYQDLEDMQILVESAWQHIHRRRKDHQLEVLSAAIQQSPDSIVITDVNGHIQYVNHAFEQTTGYTSDDVYNRRADILNSGQNPASIFANLWQTLRKGEYWQGDLINRRKDGATYFERLQIYPLRDDHGVITRYISHGQDITERKAADERIHKLSFYDQLTELPVRTLLEERFLRLVTSTAPANQGLALIYIDLDNFKSINEALGHQAGDILLRETALRLRHQSPTPDSLSRLIGDSFVLLIESAERKQLERLANRILEKIRQPIRCQDDEISVSASLGIAIHPSHGTTFDTLLINAEAAMNEVKQSGRNNFSFFSPDMNRQSSRSLTISNAMRQSAFFSQLYLNFQPQYSFADGRMIGAEVLLRWHHPQLGEISPSEFIPLAELSGQIIAIGEWVFRTTAQQLRRWQQQGLDDFILAVNLSAQHFARPNLLEDLQQILAEEQVRAESFELELTEAMALRNPQAASKLLNALKQAGFRLAIDDFGTGYSNLEYLNKYKVDKLKIDQSFVRGLEQDSSSQAIVTAICQIASSLGMTAIAEGVETGSQLELLRQRGCKEIQGYYYSKPLSAEDFEKCIRSKQLEGVLNY